MTEQRSLKPGEEESEEIRALSEMVCKLQVLHVSGDELEQMLDEAQVLLAKVVYRLTNGRKRMISGRESR